MLNEDIEKLELFLAHNLPDLVCYLVGPVVVFAYLMTVNIPLALVSLVPLVLAVAVMGIMFRNTDDLMDRANRSISTLNSVMIEYINGMKLIKAYNMGSKSFQKFSSAIHEENAMWNETSRRMGPPYASFVVIIECGMLLMVPLGGMFFLRGSLTASAFLLFLYVGSLYLTEIRPLQELGTNFANVLGAVTKAKEILDIPVYQGGSDFPESHDIELRNVRFSYDGKTDVLQGVNLKIRDGERMALVGRSGAGKSTIIELVSRFYDVQEGEVLIGGKNVQELDYDTILKKRGHRVPEDLPDPGQRFGKHPHGGAAPVWRRCGRPRKRHRSTTLSCPCRMATTPRWAASAPASPAAKSSASPSPGPS